MNKKTFSYFFLILALFIGALFYSSAIQSPLISASNSIKIFYHNTLTSVENTIDKYFFQADKIQELKIALKNHQKMNLEMQQYTSELNDLYKESNSTLTFHPDVELVRTISYQKFGDFYRLWMDIKDYNSSKIYGLIYHDTVAGIVINEDEKPLALLNNDIKSTYSVSVGESKAPGIAHGNNDENIVVSFIPAWFAIKVGDEVTTSGLDNIFFKGLKVGKVISIKKSQGYQNAVVSPYFKSNEPDYFHIIRRVK
ncbi:rod shape-determining protein MreC [Sulfurimonas sp.]